MPAYLVTGNPGSGKTTLVAELTRRGVAAIDADDDEDLSHWEDEAGNRVLRSAGPLAPDRDWLRSHRWVWNRRRMEELLSQPDGPVFVCGLARNVDAIVDLFDRMFLLRIDEATQEARLVAFDARHPSRRSEAGRQEIREGRPVFEAQMIELGAIALDGTAPAASVADELLALTAGRNE